jgi:25S rRNA (uracil2634-N3)-methyltransferase
MGTRKGKGLKAALTSQQSRFRAKKKLLDGTKVSEERLRRNGHSVSQHIAQESSLPGQTFRSKKVPRPFQRPTIPFKPTNQILLIGEGNFSFARALIDDPPEELASLPPQNITATGYDTEEECYVKHPASRLAVSFLRDCGVEVIFGVDATRLEKHASLKGKRWDRIVWNFPHAGAV